MTIPSSSWIIEFDFWCSGILINLIGMVGILGNSLSLIILSRPQMRSSINYLLIALARCDIILIITSMFLFGFNSIYPYSYADDGGGSMFWFRYTYNVYPRIIKFLFTVAVIAQTANCYLTLLVSLERYVAVCHPLRAVSRNCNIIHYYFRYGYYIIEPHRVQAESNSCRCSLTRYFPFACRFEDCRRWLAKDLLLFGFILFEWLCVCWSTPVKTRKGRTCQFRLHITQSILFFRAPSRIENVPFKKTLFEIVFSTNEPKCFHNACYALRLLFGFHLLHSSAKSQQWRSHLPICTGNTLGNDSGKNGWKSLSFFFVGSFFF